MESGEMSNKIVVMWNEGITSGEIAKELGVTRNVVIGRVSRLRKNGVTLRSLQKIKPSTKREVKTRMGWVMKRQPKPKNAPVISLDQFTFDSPPPVQRVDITQLTSLSCRYILDQDPKRGALYCGDTRHYRSYCEAHAKMCYVPVRHSS